MCFFLCKQKAAYEVRISDWSSDVCSSDLVHVGEASGAVLQAGHEAGLVAALQEGTVHLVRVAEAGHLAELLGLARRQGSRLADHPALEIGRASCRERVCQYV